MFPITPSVRIIALALLIALGCIATPARAVNKDVPYVPTPEEVVAEMLKQAQIRPGDLLYDLGCGDGRIVVTAARQYNARGIGVDIDPQRIAESNANAQAAGVSDRVKFVTGNLFDMDFKDADVVTLYLLPTVNMKLRPKLLSELRPGVRVVSHAFDMGDWAPDNELNVDPDGQTVYLWIIPAKAAGDWSATLKSPSGEQKAELKLEQKFQNVTGTATIDGKPHKITDGKLRGKELTFTLTASPATKYTATIEGDKLTGESISATRQQAE